MGLNELHMPDLWEEVIWETVAGTGRVQGHQHLVWVTQSEGSQLRFCMVAKLGKVEILCNLCSPSEIMPTGFQACPHFSGGREELPSCCPPRLPAPLRPWGSRSALLKASSLVGQVSDFRPLVLVLVNSATPQGACLKSRSDRDISPPFSKNARLMASCMQCTLFSEARTCFFRFLGHYSPSLASCVLATFQSHLPESFHLLSPLQHPSHPVSTWKACDWCSLSNTYPVCNVSAHSLPLHLWLICAISVFHSP